MQTYNLTSADIAWLLEMVQEADRCYLDVRVAIDDGLKVKLGAGAWTPPLGLPED